jgi:hypothetical protein
MHRIIKLWLIALVVIGICSIAFTFYRTVVENSYATIDASTN